MATSPDFIEFIKERLEHISNWNMKKMFGGVGIFREDKMFAMISSDNKFYLRVNDDSIPNFVDKGMNSFTHNKNMRANMPYYECPTDVLEDGELLKSWSDVSYQTAVLAKQKKTKKKKKK